MFAQLYLNGSIDEGLITDEDLCENCPVHKTSFKFTARDWAKYLTVKVKWDGSIKDPVLEKNIEGVELMAGGTDLTSNEPAMCNLLQDVKRWQWIQKAHTQSTERCVCFSGYLARNNKSEGGAAAIFSWTSITKIPVDDIIRNHLKTHVKRENQHVSKGVGDERVIKSVQGRNSDAKRKKSGTTLTSRVYPTAFRAMVQIQYVMDNCASSEESDAIKSVMKEKKASGELSMKQIRTSGTIAKVEKARVKNNVRIRNGKRHRDPTTIRVVHVDIQTRHDGSTIQISKFTKVSTLPYLVKELLARNITVPDTMVPVSDKAPNNTFLRKMLLIYEIRKRKDAGEIFDSRGIETMGLKDLGAVIKNTSGKDNIELLHDDHDPSTIQTILNIS
jgi:hypothetical protein